MMVYRKFLHMRGVQVVCSILLAIIYNRKLLYEVGGDVETSVSEGGCFAIHTFALLRSRVRAHVGFYTTIKSADVFMCFKDGMITAACVGVCTYNTWDNKS